MTILGKYQNIIIIGIVILVAFGIYSYFFAGKQKAALTAEDVSTATPADQDLIALLTQLKAISLDDSIFSDTGFVSLQDFSKELVPEPVGRQNPFAPLGK